MEYQLKKLLVFDYMTYTIVIFGTDNFYPNVIVNQNFLFYY